MPYRTSAKPAVEKRRTFRFRGPENIIEEILWSIIGTMVICMVGMAVGWFK